MFDVSILVFFRMWLKDTDSLTNLSDEIAGSPASMQR